MHLPQEEAAASLKTSDGWEANYVGTDSQGNGSDSRKVLLQN